jgi:hypothetical protein
MVKVRRPAVAGTFYPADRQELHRLVTKYLAVADTQGPVPKALIVPHAGYIYSGPVAASAYVYLVKAQGTVSRVVLLGPAHWVAFSGLAASSAEAFVSPLGEVPVDRHALQQILKLPSVHVLDEAHVREHSLEVQLPFLQVVLGNFSLVPLLVGEASPEEIAVVLDLVWNGPATAIVISSDLSHYYDYETARRLDQVTSHAIEQLRWQDIQTEQACGYYPVRGFLYAAQQHRLSAKAVDVRNSGDTAGPHDTVVGYGAYIFTDRLSTPHE